MNWKTVTGLCIGGALFALLGLVAGINMNPQSTVRFVPNLGSLGDWLAAAGTFAAVWVALSQSSKQAEKERPRAKVYQEQQGNSWSVRVLSEGLVPFTVLSSEIKYDGLSRSLDLSTWLPVGKSLPQKLERGDVLNLTEMNERDFASLARCIADPVIKELGDQGITPNDHDLGINEAFFDSLKAASEGEAKLIIRSGHCDDEHQLPNGLVAKLFALVAEEERNDRLYEITRAKNDFAELKKLFDVVSSKKGKSQE
jgi:hypothetical protein